MRKVLITLLAASAALVACQKETELKTESLGEKVKITIKASQDEATKTVLNGTDAKWAEGDKVTVMYKKSDESTWSTAESSAAATTDEYATATFEATLTSPDAGENAYAIYPANNLSQTVADQAKISIAATQHPTGTGFDGGSDIMISKPFTPSTDPITTQFARANAVLKVSIDNATLNGEKLLSLSVRGAADMVGDVLVGLSDHEVKGVENGSNTVTAEYTSPSPVTVGTNDVYLIVVPQTFASGSHLIISGETENYIFSKDITLSQTIYANAGHIMPLRIKSAFDEITLKDKIFVEARFDDNDGTGGNDGSWSGSIATKDIKLPGDWSHTNGKGAYRCVKFGTGSAGGSLTTKSVTIPSAYSSVKLHFKAAAWVGSKEGTSLSLSAENAAIKDAEDKAVSSVTTVKGEWTTYDLFIKSITDDVSVSFSTDSGNKRFFIDDVIIYYGTSVPKIDPELSYATTSVEKTYGDAPFTNSLTNAHNVAVTYSSDNTEVATVSNEEGHEGEVTIIKAGSARITASFAGDSEYSSDAAYYDLTVNKAAAGLAYAVENVAKNIGDAKFTNPLTNPHGLAVTYDSTDKDVATVDSNGEVTIKAGGSTLISATFATNDYYLAGEAIYELTVKKAIKTMSFASSSVDVDELDTVALPSLTIEDSGDNDISGDVTVIYTSSNTDIAAENSGEIEGWAPGHVTLTASITDDDEYEDKSTTLDVYVLGELPAPATVTLTTLNKAALVASWEAALGAEKYDWQLINTSTFAVAKEGSTTGTSLNIDYSSSNVPAGTYKLSVSSALETAHAGITSASATDSGTTKTVTSSITLVMDSFDAISGNVDGDSNISYEAAKGDAGTAPAVNSNEIRIYQNGGLLTITANNSKKIKSVTIGSSMATKVQVSIDSGSFSSDNSIVAHGTYTKGSLTASSVQFKCTGTDKNSRLYLNYLSVTYE